MANQEHKGLRRIWNAFFFSLSGLYAATAESFSVDKMVQRLRYKLMCQRFSGQFSLDFL